MWKAICGKQSRNPPIHRALSCFARIGALSVSLYSRISLIKNILTFSSAEVFTHLIKVGVLYPTFLRCSKIACNSIMSHCLNYQTIQTVFQITRFLERELQFGSKRSKIQALKLIQSINGYASEAVLVRFLYHRELELRNSARYTYMWLSQGDPLGFGRFFVSYSNLSAISSSLNVLESSEIDFISS